MKIKNNNKNLLQINSYNFNFKPNNINDNFTGFKLIKFNNGILQKEFLKRKLLKREKVSEIEFNDSIVIFLFEKKNYYINIILDLKLLIQYLLSYNSNYFLIYFQEIYLFER